MHKNMSNNKKYDIFISYSRHDLQQVKPIKEEIERITGASCWMDLDGIESGEQFKKVIISAINSSDTLLFMLSNRSMRSEWALDELDFAKKKEKRLVIVYLEYVEQTDEFYFTYHKYDQIDWRDSSQKEKLLRDINKWIGKIENEEKQYKKTDADKFFARGYNLYRKEQYEEAAKCYRKAADLGHKDAIYNLADCYYYGKGVKLNYEEAFKLYCNAAERGFAIAQWSVATCYEEGIGVEKNLAEALKWYKKAAEQGDADAKKKVEEIENLCSETAEDEKIPKDTIADFTVNGVSFKMIRVQGGSFKMGATPEQGNDSFKDEKPAHDVFLDDYYIGETEVTQSLWNAVMGENPSRWKGYNLPVENVSWEDCQEFVTRLNSVLLEHLPNGYQFCKPTEAQWEYAARGGNKSQGFKYAGSDNIDDVAWYAANSDGKTHPVKTKSPNELCLYDMSGNIWEWCQDWYGNYHRSSRSNPSGPSSGVNHVVRGGSWYDKASYCRVSYRDDDGPDGPYNFGFRLALCQQGNG